MSSIWHDVRAVAAEDANERALRDERVATILTKFGKLAAAFEAAKFLNESLMGFIEGLELAVNPPNHSELLTELRSEIAADPTINPDPDGFRELEDPAGTGLQSACWFGPQIGHDIERLRALLDDEVTFAFSKATPYPVEDSYSSHHVALLSGAFMPFWQALHAIEDNEPRPRGSVKSLTALDIANHFETIHEVLECFNFDAQHITEAQLYKECERVGVDMLALHRYDEDPGYNSDGKGRLWLPNELPKVTFGPGSATVEFRDKTYADVDLKAGEALAAICDEYPMPAALTRTCGGKAKLIVAKLPDEVRKHVYSVPGNKGYTFR